VGAMTAGRSKREERRGKKSVRKGRDEGNEREEERRTISVRRRSSRCRQSDGNRRTSRGVGHRSRWTAKTKAKHEEEVSLMLSRWKERSCIHPTRRALSLAPTRTPSFPQAQPLELLSRPPLSSYHLPSTGKKVRKPENKTESNGPGQARERKERFETHGKG